MTLVTLNACLISRLPDPGAFWAAVSAVMDRLAAKRPVDYAARRDALGGLTEIPPNVLDKIVVRWGSWPARGSTGMPPPGPGRS